MGPESFTKNDADDFIRRYAAKDPVMYRIPHFILRHRMGNSGQLILQNAWKHPHLIHGSKFASRENPWKPIFDQVLGDKQNQPRRRKRDDARSSWN
eukprot:12008161-Karenia_brevis.AAC.1